MSEAEKTGSTENSLCLSIRLFELFATALAPSHAKRLPVTRAPLAWPRRYRCRRNVADSGRG